MTAITLESDSSHSPPVLYQSNTRSSKKSLKTAAILQNRTILCEDSHSERRIIPLSILTTRKHTRRAEAAIAKAGHRVIRFY